MNGDALSLACQFVSANGRESQQLCTKRTPYKGCGDPFTWQHPDARQIPDLVDLTGDGDSRFVRFECPNCGLIFKGASRL